MEKGTTITKGILSVALLFGATVAAFWLIRRSPSFPIHHPHSTANPYTGLDSGMDAIRLAQAVESPPVSNFRFQVSRNGWVRLRGIDLTKVPETRESLLKLRAEGIKTCVFLRLSSPDWKRKYLPDDLRESYEHGRKLGAAYGDLVDAWEVDNEPDLGFVPESAERYTAFLKATYLGLKAGAREQRTEGGRQTSEVSQLGAEINLEGPSSVLRPPSSAAKEPLIVFGALGLPPGPWLERFAANNGFAYTDGYNYHYYGYAEDFTGVYRQHEAALRELGAGSLEPGADSLKLIAKSYPIFLTEVGYGMLGKEARDSKEGRLRQWRWFKSVGEQANALRIEAPMAFYLPPYLEYDTSEYGLTVRTKPAAGSKEHGARSSNPDDTSYLAGGIDYSPEDFGAEKAEPWMTRIGSDIGGNQATPALAQWLETRIKSAQTAPPQLSAFSSQPSNGSRAWQIATAAPSPVVIDFLPGQGLSHVKRYNGLFVTGREPPVHTKPETGRRLGADGEANLKPEVLPTKALPLTPSPPAPSRSEDFILQVRTQNGNLYEVYPVRQATPDWQRFLEPGDNFTMAFYGRAALPWRFKENKPASLVIVMYPKSLPAVYEFRRPQLLRLGAQPNNQEPITNNRYGSGRIVLYNFSDKPVTGRLQLPAGLAFTPITDNSQPITPLPLTLAPNERREIPVTVKVPWERYTRIEVPITFVPDVATTPIARYLTALIPDIGGMPATLVSALLPKHGARSMESGANHRFLSTRPRVTEEAPSVPSTGFSAFAQPGATVERTADGFSIAVTARSPGKPQRIEVEIPWPDGLDFGEDEFLSVEFRLRP